MDYLVISLFILFVSALLYGCKKSKSIGLKIITYCLVILFCACRQVIPDVPNSDATVYQQFFEAAKKLSFHSYMENIGGMEYVFYGFFWLCAQSGFSYWIVRVIYYSVMCVLILLAVKEGLTKHNKYTDYLFLVTNLVLSHCLMRNTLGYLLGWLAILYFYNKKYYKAILLAIIGTLVHSSCLIVLAYMVFDYSIKKIKDLRVTVSFVFVYYMAIIFGFPIILEYLARKNAKIAYYYILSEGSFAVVTNVVRILIIVLLLGSYFSLKRYKNDVQYKNIIILDLFALSMIFVQLINGIAYRFLGYFDVVNVLVFSYIRGNRSDRLLHIGKHRVDYYIISFINVMVFVMFIYQSLRGYGLIPIRW